MIQENNMVTTLRKGRAKLSTDMEAEEVGVGERPVRKPASKQKKIVAAKNPKSPDSLKTSPGVAENENSRKAGRRGKVANETDKVAKTDRAVKAAKPGKAYNTADTGTTSPETKKNKLRRDNYSIPESEHKQLAVLKKRCTDQGRAIKKSYLLRAGIVALTRMNDKEFLSAIERIK
jgi:hypothetical protein